MITLEEIISEMGEKNAVLVGLAYALGEKAGISKVLKMVEAQALEKEDSRAVPDSLKEEDALKEACANEGLN